MEPQSSELNPQEPKATPFRVLLNAPNAIVKLIDAAVVLSVLTGIVYIWGRSYYSGFIDGLGLKQYEFAFNIPPNELLYGGVNLLNYIIPGVPLAFISVGVILFVVLGMRQELRLAIKNRRVERNNSSNKLQPKGEVFRETTNKAVQQLDESTDDPVVEEIGDSGYVYVAYGLSLLFLIILLILGILKSADDGRKVAKEQLSNSLSVKVLYGNSEEIEGILCGRIGNDFILRSPDNSDNYVILKESAISQIIVTPKLSN